MKLTDISPLSADVLNAKMKEMLGWNLKLNGLNESRAKSLLESVNKKLEQVRMSGKIHTSEKDPNYVGMLMSQQVLESRVKELAEEAKEQKMAKKVEKKIKKNLKENSGTDFKSMSVAALKKFIKDHGGMKSLDKSVASEVKAATAELQSRGVHLTESWIRRKIAEDQVTQAQSVIAAKDMVDSIQDMLEDLSKMLNEQLPPLTDSIRANIGENEASSFQTTASESLNTLLGAAQTAREQINNAVLGLTGEAPVSVPNVGDDSQSGSSEMGDADFDMDSESDEFAASDAATGGNLPLGREKRV